MDISNPKNREKTTERKNTMVGTEKDPTTIQISRHVLAKHPNTLRRCTAR
jgi:hypothetical protein